MPSLTSIAEAILARAKKLDAYLESNNIPYPSFDEDTLDRLPDELQEDRWALANSSHELKKLTRGAVMNTLDTIFSWTDNLGLRVVYHYQLAKAVPLNGTASYAEIAAGSGLKESLCRRFIRVAMSNNVFDEEPTTKRVRHTAVSRLLATDQGFGDAIGLQLEEMAPASSKVIAAWDKYSQDSSEPRECAFSLYNETDKPFFAALVSQPERGRRFGNAMRFHTKGDSWDPRHILASFDWSSVDKPGDVVIDIGGGYGQISQYIARHTNSTRFIVQDLPQVVSEAQAQLPKDLEDRIEFAVHDFFTPQAIEPAPSIFLLRWILHNWSDKYSISILKSLVPAMRKDSKVLIYEYVLEDGPVTDLSDRFGFQMEGIMTTGFNAQERSAQEFKSLLTAADERYVVDAVRRPTGSTMSIVQVSWLG
ncbi:MAG: hypothetical protein Q9195_008728 [Heterodermia aff. obscurata]